MISFVAREVGIEDESPLLLVGVSESTDDDGQDFFFQCDLRRNDYPEVSNWPEGESYSVSEQGGRSAYGCVREVWFQGNLLRFTLSARGASALALMTSPTRSQSRTLVRILRRFGATSGELSPGDGRSFTPRRSR
jgi:hypothetical protein